MGWPGPYGGRQCETLGRYSETGADKGWRIGKKKVESGGSPGKLFYWNKHKRAAV